MDDRRSAARRRHRTRPTGRLTPSRFADLHVRGRLACQFRSSSAGFFRERGVDGPAAEVFRVGEQVSIVSVIEACPSRAWITFGLRFTAISVEA
jgi:hypothetical protein